MSNQFSIKDFLESARAFHETRNKDKNGRYRSWEYCNKVFNEKHVELIEKRKNGSDLSDEDYDFLALHLSFYLASCGMYRGSTTLLFTDYKIHIPIVKELMKEENDNLWNITYESLNNEKSNIALYLYQKLFICLYSINNSELRLISNIKTNFDITITMIESSEAEINYRCSKFVI